MSFLRSKILAAVFAVLSMVAQPYMAVAQDFSWIEPSGPPLDNNVAPPVNVGPIGQVKEGELFITKQGGNGFAVPFSNASFGFYMPGIFGSSPADFPSTVNIYGNLLYRPQGLSGASPAAGMVLTTNDQGYARWAHPEDLIGANGLPQGNNLGDLLYWNETDQKWESTNLTLGDGEALVWDATTGQWTSTVITSGPPCVTGCDLPPGNTGDTLRFNAGAWQANNIVTINGTNPAVVGIGNPANTGIVNINTSATVPNAHITLASPGIQLQPGSNPIQAGQVLTSTTTQGNIDWVDPVTLLGSLLPSGTSGQTFVHNGTNWTATSKLTHSQASVDIPNPYDLDFNPDGFLSTLSNDAFVLDVGKSHLGKPGQGFVNLYGANNGILGNNVGFGPMFGETQTVTFNSDAVKIKGPFQNNQLTPGLGRFLYSKDAEGSVAWNPYFEYEDIVYNGDQHIDALKIVETSDPDRKSGFANYGDYTYLQNWVEIDGLTFINNDLTVTGNSEFNGNVTVTDAGDLYLNGIDALAPVNGQGQPVSLIPLEHLCITGNDRKVVLCDPGEAKPTPMTIVGYSETFLPGTSGVTFPRPNQAPGDVMVEACAGGGGGGGGGRGWEDGQNEEGDGGGGGGGGARGACDTTTINPSAGDQMSWNIGSGGSGGSAGQLDEFFQPCCNVITDTTATGGQPGGDTGVSFEGAQIFYLLGGAGGNPGGNASPTSGPGEGNDGGATAFIGAGWHSGLDGQLGSANPGVSGPFGINAGAGMGYGGRGGKGEANVANQGGSAGLPGQPLSGYQYGGNGGQGAPSHGGGGGGGGSGKNYDVGDQQIRNHGGWGGNGGSGYVKLNYNIYVADDVPTSETFTSSGTFDLATIPADATNITFEVWGGAGGGGGAVTSVPSSNYTRRGGGGGAGAYGSTTLPNSSVPNTGTLSITIGTGGAAGVSSGTIASVTAGGNGSQTVIAGGVSITASGGQGGSRMVGSGYPGNCIPQNAPGGAAVSGATPTAGGVGGSCGEPQTTQAGPYGGGGVQSTGYGNGGNGAKIVPGGMGGAAVITPAQAGQPGKVIISWD